MSGSTLLGGAISDHPAGLRAGRRGGRSREDGASGLTVPEATAAGMLPYQIIAGLRLTDPISPEDVQSVMLEQEASKLNEEDGLQLRFATREEAEACRQRLIEKRPAKRRFGSSAAMSTFTTTSLWPIR